MSSRQKKLIATTTAAVLILALGLAGTFAASGSTDSDGGFGEDVTTSLFLHDDFSKNWDGDVMDRDVYVENTGDTSLYVRMRLDEFMTYGGKKLVGGDRNQKSSWKPHVPAGTNPSECGTEIHDYFTIQMGNDTGVKYKPETKNTYDPAITEAEKTETTSAAKIILMEEYLKAEVKPEACWVLDAADGYAYWHQQLPKGKATGLILNSITNTGLIDESYYYGINAKAEAVTEMDLNAWLNGRPPKDSEAGEAFDQASTDAIRFLKNLSPKYIEITDEMAANGANDFDGDNDGYLTKEENAEYEAEKGVTPTPIPDKEVEINTMNFPDNALMSEIQKRDTDGDGKLSKEEINAIESLNLSGTGITDYTGLEHFTALTDLNVSNNGLTVVDFLSRTPNLTSLNCSANNLVTLTLSKGAYTKVMEALIEERAGNRLANVDCSNNQLTGLTVSSAPGLTTLNCSGNKITKLDISGNASLSNITADSQTITVNVTFDKTKWKYQGGDGLFTSGTIFGAGDAAFDSTNGGLTMETLTDKKTSIYSLPLCYNGKQKGVLSGTITFTGTIYVPTTLKERVGATATGGTVELENKDGSKTAWIVYNKTEKEADLITKDCITCREFDKGQPGYRGWPSCQLRTWLNDGTSGYKSELSNEMKEAIVPQALTTAIIWDNWETVQSSTDEIYLLTETGSGSGKVGKTIGATVTLTVEQLKCSDQSSDGIPSTNWLLRSPGWETDVAYVDSKTGTPSFDSINIAFGVRPSLTISLQ